MGWDPSFLPNQVIRRMDPENQHRYRRKEPRKIDPEISLHNQFWGFLRRHEFEDVEYSNPRKSTRARKGRPDFLICRDGCRLAIEFKVGNNKLSQDQEQFFEMAKRQNNPCFCLRDYPSAIRLMQEFFSFTTQD